MKIEGNIKTANKFYVKSNNNGIFWVPNLEIAKQYVNDPRNKKWYLQTIYATNDEIVEGYDGKLYLKSELPKKLTEDKKINEFEIFKEEGLKFIKGKLLEIANLNEFNSIEEMISWKDSTILQFSKLGQKALQYRDKCYMYYFDCLKKYKNNFDKMTLENTSKYYKEFIQNFPIF